MPTPPRSRALALALALAWYGPAVLAQEDAVLVTAFTAFTDTSTTDHVVMDLEEEVLVLARAAGDSGSVRIHWRSSGGEDGWEAIALLAERTRGFGRSIDLHNGLLAIGIDANDGTSQGDTGSVRIYRVDPLAVDPVLALDTLFTPLVQPPGPGPDERFGHTVHWVGDTLMVGAPGAIYLDPSGGGAGKVHGFVRNGDQWYSCGSIQPDPTIFQLPYLGAFGELMASSADDLVIAAPFSGSALMLSDPPSFSNVIGSLHFYHRDGSGSATCGWTLASIEQDITLGPDTQFNTTNSAFLTLETGRQGIHFGGDRLLAHISANYTFQHVTDGTYSPYGLGADDEGRVLQGLREGCDHCGVRTYRRTDDQDWEIMDPSLLPPLSGRTLGLGGWNTFGDVLLVNRYDTLGLSWSTDVHMHDGVSGTWPVLFTIPETDGNGCARFNTPLAMQGEWIVRLPVREDADCDPFHTIIAEVFRAGAWVGGADPARQPHRLLPFPNPATTTFSLTRPPGTSWTVRIHDATGRPVRLVEMLAPEGRARVDVSTLAPGPYVLSAYDRQGTPSGTATLVVQPR